MAVVWGIVGMLVGGMAEGIFFTLFSDESPCAG